MLAGSASARTSPTHLHHHYNNASASTSAGAFPMSEPYPTASWTPSYPHAMSPTIPIVPSNDEYTSYFPSPADASVSTPLPPAAHEISDESYVMYYFESVRKEQFVFAGNSLTNTLYSVRLPSIALPSARSSPARASHRSSTQIQKARSPMLFVLCLAYTTSARASPRGSSPQTRTRTRP